jgi:flagellar hook-basal body complex protein FliE
MRRIETEPTLRKLEAIQAKLDTLAGKADQELSEAISGASASLEIAIELLNRRIEQYQIHINNAKGALT